MKSTLFLLFAWLMAFIATGITGSAQASEALVKNDVTVEILGMNPTDARDKAMMQAQRNALVDLLNRLAPPEQVTDITKRTTDGKISSMVRGVEVLEEKMSPERYIATMRVSFDAGSISSLIQEQPESKEEAQLAFTSGAFLILPLFIDGKSSLLWEDSNPWRNVWRALSLEITTGEIVVPFGDGNDTAVARVGNLASANYSTLAPFAVRYGVSDIVIAQATFKRDPDMSIDVILRRINRIRNEVSLLSYRADPTETREALLTRAAKDVAATLQDRKLKEAEKKQEIKIGEKSQLMVLASITTLDSWTDLRARLNKLPMIDEITVIAMSPQQIDLMLSYRGTSTSLSSAIKSQKIRLVEKENYWVIARE